MDKLLLRKLPKIDVLLADECLSSIKETFLYTDIYDMVTEVVNSYRQNILDGSISSFELKDIISDIERLSKKKSNRLKKVINATGVIIHTNLGRAVLNKDILKNSFNIATNYSNLEFDLEDGKRGNRYKNIEELICKVTGAEAALVVNNNAAAVVLTLNEFAKNKEVIISRGELVEIGGSFRIPEIMKLSNSILKEIGTTNKTHLFDYENNINENTSVLLKVHKSNFNILGFTEEVSVKDLARLARNNNLICIEDLGSGVLIDLSKYGITKEPTVQESVKANVDLITFSGDKLLGGIQCGIIVGKKKYIEKLKKNQFLRVFRLDKLSLAILEDIFKLYLNEKNAINSIPTLKLITENPEEVYKRALTLSNMLKNANIENEIIDTLATIGGGSMPGVEIKSYAISFNSKNNTLKDELRKLSTPIISRTHGDKLLLDLKTIFEDDFVYIVDSLKDMNI